MKVLNQINTVHDELTTDVLLTANVTIQTIWRCKEQSNKIITGVLFESSKGVLV